MTFKSMGGVVSSVDVTGGTTCRTATERSAQCLLEGGDGGGIFAVVACLGFGSKEFGFLHAGLFICAADEEEEGCNIEYE